MPSCFVCCVFACPEAAPVLNRLQNQHAEGAYKIKELEQALTRYQQGGAREFPKFAQAVEDYAAFHWDHMRIEEQDVMPLAEKHFSAQDWHAVDSAFAEHSDPLRDTKTGAR